MRLISKQIRDGFTLLVAFFTSFAFAASPGLTPAKLTCQGLVNPQGLDAANPSLSWISAIANPTARGQIQTAYQILVADSASALGKDAGNLWDSGKVMSDQSTHVAYAGKPLPPHQASYWKVRVGFEDSCTYNGNTARNNEELVLALGAELAAAGFSIATTAEARAILLG